MRTSRKWLSQYMDLSDLSLEELAEKITNAGLEVEAAYPLSSGTNLVIGQVVECEMHPDSDHLHITKVDLGDEIVQIVCGAPNVAEGQKVIVAKPGAKLPGGEIKKGAIRGQESNGMICALFELGVDPHMLSEEQKNGIEILPEDAPVGYTDPLGYLGYDDEILEIGLTPNRSDCQAQFNLAKEVGAILNREVVLPEFDAASDLGDHTRFALSSKTEKCPLFLEKVIGSITIKESPKWMKELLRASGMHSINNVVDISNIVMLETGQPMHFYDIDAIKDQEITVADGFEEEYTALDGITYQLLPEDIVITNQGKPIGIAGIMGGDDSKILETTHGLIIECASFDHVSIRNTTRRLNLATESSLRYQKGIEPMAPFKAIDRAVQLLIEYADATAIEETVQIGEVDGLEKILHCTIEQINDRLGTNFSQEEVMDVFERLDFVPEIEDGVISVVIPSYRTDMEGMADLSEEVIRLIGYDRLPSTLPFMPMTEGKLDEQQRMIRTTENVLSSLGLEQCITYTLISTLKKDNAILSNDEAIELAMPMSEERRWIRTSILPSLLGVVAYNQARKLSSVNVFEISDVEGRCQQRKHLAICLSGPLEMTPWLHEETPADFYTLKGLLETLFDSLGINRARIHFTENKDEGHFHPFRSACIKMGKETLGYMGEIHPKYAKENDVKNVYMAELDLSSLMETKKSKIKFTPISKYPTVTRDLALIVDRELPTENIVQLIEKHGRDQKTKEKIVKEIEIFDVYEGEHVKENEKSIAIRIVFGSDTHTLKDEEINNVFETMLESLKRDLNAQLRG
ncbi:phenylalanine--tRNA ligase subunit beta [Dubosiella newyorkensis]|uniref:phenylalanine--tRNA ligase subunit beta n=1 Tax=Dubosiella newyorkensis TaxID=1862672 RepID=UPI0027295F7E|nr:phenylalanine--tRNA ligase subunit beta [Dubosiella newyorkensis]